MMESCCNLQNRFRFSDANGEYSFKPIIVDDYLITATATGYQPLEETEFHAALGDVNHFDFELVK